MADNTPSGSGPSPSPAQSPAPAPASQPAPAVEQAPAPQVSLVKSGPAVERAQESAHVIAARGAREAAQRLSPPRGVPTPGERQAAAARTDQQRIEDIAARLVKGANQYAANIAAQSTANNYVDRGARTWSEYQMGMSSSGTGTGVEQAPNTPRTEAGLNTDKGITQSKTGPTANTSAPTTGGGAGLDADKGMTQGKTGSPAPRPAQETAAAKSPAPQAEAVRSASAGLGAPPRSGSAKSTLSTRKSREARAAQQPKFHPSFPVSNAPQHSGTAKNTVSTPRNRTRRTSQQIALGFKRLLGR